MCSLMLVCLSLAEKLRETGHKSHLIFVINRNNWQVTLPLSQEPHRVHHQILVFILLILRVGLTVRQIQLRVVQASS